MNFCLKGYNAKFLINEKTPFEGVFSYHFQVTK